MIFHGIGWKLTREEGSVLAEVECKSWNAFFDLMNSENGLRSSQNYCYRGHASENWTLESTLKRQLQDDLPENIESKTVENFKRFCSGRRGHNPAVLKENEWWALGQHYGLHTPLLDWSESPYVAAFFAFNSPNHETDNVVIWVLSKDINQYLDVQKLKDSEKIQFITPYLDENSRLINQRGVFTRSPHMLCVEAWVRNTISDGEYIALAKVKIPASEKLLALDSLDKMNINSLTLFPDLTGAAEFTNYVLLRDKEK